MHKPADPYDEIREAIAKLCARFPGSYWRALDREMAYPKEFVAALTQAGWLGALVPEEYGGSGLPLSAGAAILEEIHKSGGSAGACHAQMYTMGTLLRHGSEPQKRQYLPEIASGSLRLQAFGVTEPTSGTDTGALKTTARLDGDHYVINGQKIWTSRAEHSDLQDFGLGISHAQRKIALRHRPQQQRRGGDLCDGAFRHPEQEAAVRAGYRLARCPPDQQQPDNGKGQAIEETHQRCPQRAEPGDQMALRGIADGLGKRRPQGDRYPDPGKVGDGHDASRKEGKYEIIR